MKKRTNVGISDDELRKMYIDDNLRISDIANKLGLSESIVGHYLSKIKMKKPIENRMLNTRNGVLKKYGVINPFQSEEIKNKIRTTNIRNLGVEYPQQSDIVRMKSQSTNLKKYGSNNIAQRHIKHIDEWNNKHLFKNHTDKSYQQLCDYFGVTSSKVYTRIHRFELENCFDWYQSKQTSIYEYEVQKILTDIGIEFEPHDRTHLDGKEIDIFIPKLMVGIEFNGDFWHQSSINRVNKCPLDKNYHKNKSYIAAEKGISIYHIFEYEWINNKNVIVNQLKNMLHIEKQRIFARNTTVKEINAQTKNNFLKSNHRQGEDRSSVKLGLFYNDMLVSVMTFRKPHQTKIADIELSRFCSLANTNIIGGASKLFSYFIKNYNFSKVLSYQDIARTNGNLYEKLQFTLDHISKPNYVWVDMGTGKFITRYKVQMKHEKSMMLSKGYVQIFDCGNKVWIYEK